MDNNQSPTFESLVDKVDNMFDTIEVMMAKIEFEVEGDATITPSFNTFASSVEALNVYVTLIKNRDAETELSEQIQRSFNTSIIKLFAIISACPDIFSRSLLISSIDDAKDVDSMDIESATRIFQSGAGYFRTVINENKAPNKMTINGVTAVLLATLIAMRDKVVTIDLESFNI